MTGVIVTGPPRSGTSATARLLDLCGLHVAVASDRVGGGPNNPTGHWESKSVLAANNRLLADAGTRWWCPPKEPLRDDAGVFAVDADTFHAVHRGQPWMCKDPRFAFTLPPWRRALGDVEATIAVVRRPDEVVASMRRTWALTAEHAAALWVRYLASAFAAGRGQALICLRFPQVMYEVEASVGALAERLESLDICLGPPRRAELDAFLRAPRGASETEDALPHWAWQWWEQLEGAGMPDPLLGEPAAVEDIIHALREELRAGRPIDMRPLFATEAIG